VELVPFSTSQTVCLQHALTLLVVIDYRGRIVVAYQATGLPLHPGRHLPGGMNISLRNSIKFRHPAADVISMRIKFPPCNTGLNTRKYGAASVPVPATHCHPPPRPRPTGRRSTSMTVMVTVCAPPSVLCERGYVARFRACCAPKRLLREGYDPVIGHFIQADTIVPEAGSSKAYDRYGYVNNNPVRYNDPSGHCV